MFAHAQCFVVAGRAGNGNDVITDENVLRWRRRNGKHADDLMVVHRITKHDAFGYPKCVLMFKRNAETSGQFVPFANSVTQPACSDLCLKNCTGEVRQNLMWQAATGFGERE